MRAQSEQVAELAMRLDHLACRGDYSFEVFNDDYQGIALPRVAERRRVAALAAAARVHAPEACRSLSSAPLNITFHRKIA
jgi:hypothetical protein